MEKQRNLGIFNVRSEKGITQVTLAEKMKVTRMTIYRWELNPEGLSMTTIKKIATALGVKKTTLINRINKGE